MGEKISVRAVTEDRKPTIPLRSAIPVSVWGYLALPVHPLGPLKIVVLLATAVPEGRMVILYA